MGNYKCFSLSACLVNVLFWHNLLKRAVGENLVHVVCRDEKLRNRWATRLLRPLLVLVQETLRALFQVHKSGCPLMVTQFPSPP